MELTVSVCDGLSLSTSLTSSYQMDSALQNTLKRVSREIQVRKNGGPKDSKQPLPPVYEMIGNSIAYQLLLQSHPAISIDIINSMYPVLKNLQSSVQWLYDDYLDSFKVALKKKATPMCLHPADIPTVKFLVDLCVHASSIPLDEKNAYIVPSPSLWMHLLAIFSASSQNQACLVEYRCASKVVGCMNLTSMADDIKLQCYGWEVLSSILQSPPQDITKPAVHIQAITLLMGHIRRQCEQFYHDDDLMRAILKFLSKLTSITRACSLKQSADSDTPLSYTKEDSLEIISLLEKTSIRQILLDLPEHLQDDLNIKTMLQSVLLSLAPVIEPPAEMAIPTSIVKRRLPLPPPKPKRSKVRSQYFTSDKETKITQQLPRTPRKLPVIPAKTLSTSHSSENIAERSVNNDNVSVSYDAEYSLPAGIISRHVTSRASGNKQQSTSEPLDEQSLSKPRSISQAACGPQQLVHYNRVSLKRTRGSYIKAVTSSQRIYKGGEKEETENIFPKTSVDVFFETERRSGTILQALSDRKEMISSIVQLWKADKALQASSNLVMSCFFNGEADLPLFVDCLECFCSYPSQWSLGICIVLLPYLRKTATSEFQLRYLKVVNSSITLVLKRFSVIILGIKKNKHTSRVHLEQRQACYHELHLLFATLTKFEKSSKNAEEVEKLVDMLAPFNEPLS